MRRSSVARLLTLGAVAWLTSCEVDPGQVAPSIVAFTPASGPVGAVVTIRGLGFSPKVAANRVLFNGLEAPVTSASTTALVATAPVSATTGKLQVLVGGRAASSSGDFTVLTDAGADPTISGFTPSSGPVGTSVTITGGPFSAAAAGNIVELSGLAATVTAASPSSITATVPAGATTGPITVTVDGKTAASDTDFIVVDGAGGPTITGFSPKSGAVGATVTIAGASFSTQASSNTVAFNGTTATVTAASATSLTVTAPAGATTGRITVTVGGKTAASATDFTVTSTGDSATIYVSPTGSASASGTERQPIVLGDFPRGSRGEGEA